MSGTYRRDEVRAPRLKYGFSVMEYESDRSAKSSSGERDFGKGSRRDRHGVGYSVDIGADLEGGRSWGDEGGIKTTTVVTQLVESGRGRR